MFVNDICEKRKRCLCALFLIFVTVASCFALKVPELNGRVNDNAKLMNSKERQEAESYLEALEKNSGIQIAVLTIRTLDGESLESFSMKVAEKWKLGNKDRDDGALLLVAYNERAVRLEVGYGLEGTLTDTKCGLIIRNVIIPQFKEGNYGEGILSGVKTMGSILSGDVEVEEKLLAQEENEMGPLFAMCVIIVWLIIAITCIVESKFRRRRYGPGVNTVIRTINTLNSMNHGGGSGFGGGFSGGGGHFGGGGASGHW